MESERRELRAVEIPLIDAEAVKPETQRQLGELATDILQRHKSTEPYSYLDTDTDPISNRVRLSIDRGRFRRPEYLVIEEPRNTDATEFYEWERILSGGNKKIGYHEYVFLKSGRLVEQTYRNVFFGDHDVWRQPVREAAAKAFLTWLESVRANLEAQGNLLDRGKNAYSV